MDKAQITKDFRIKLKLLQRIELIVDGRFDDKGAITVYKQYFFFFIFPIDIFSVLQSVWHSQPVYLQLHEGNYHTMKWNFCYVQ